MKSLDEIITGRQTIRAFTEVELEKDKIELIIEAGRQAPYAGLVQLHVDSFRHFYVVHRDSPLAEKLKELCLDFRVKEDEIVKQKGWDNKYPVYANMISKTSKLTNADDIFPSHWMIIVAERAGMPAREHTCLGFVLANMWLKATEMDLGFRVCSTISDIKKQDELRQLLGLTQDNYVVEACGIGYAAEPKARDVPRKQPVKSIKYFE